MTRKVERAKDVSSFVVNLDYEFIADASEHKRFHDRVFKLRQIKVHNRDGSDYKPGIEALRELIMARADIDTIFENPDDLTTAIKKSGGNIRDLFFFLRNAALNALGFDSNIITTEDLEIAYTEKKSMFKDMIKGSYMDVLFHVMNDQTKDTAVAEINDTDLLMELFTTGMLVEYNGEGWYDVHPLMKEILERRKKTTII